MVRFFGFFLSGGPAALLQAAGIAAEPTPEVAAPAPSASPHACLEREVPRDVRAYRARLGENELERLELRGRARREGWLGIRLEPSSHDPPTAR